jgi:uncharacterized membrane protein
METNDVFNIIFFWVMTVIAVFQLLLNGLAFYKQKMIERTIERSEVPEALRDSSEVTFWQTVSSGLFVVLAANSMLALHFDRMVALSIFGIALAIKTIPSARWLWRYYRGAFDDDSRSNGTSG